MAVAPLISRPNGLPLPLVQVDHRPSAVNVGTTANSYRHSPPSNAVLAVAGIAAIGMFTSQTPHVVIATVILLGGMARSLQFTSMHALSYADIAPREAGAATSISSVAQQVSLSMGVAIGALALEMSQSLQGHATPQGGDFSVAIFVVAAIASLSIIKMVRLPADAGHELTGGVPLPPPKSELPSDP